MLSLEVFLQGGDFSHNPFHGIEVGRYAVVNIHNLATF
jgi:hypothetical protein